MLMVFLGAEFSMVNQPEAKHSVTPLVGSPAVIRDDAFGAAKFLDELDCSTRRSIVLTIMRGILGGVGCAFVNEAMIPSSQVLPAPKDLIADTVRVKVVAPGVPTVRARRNGEVEVGTTLYKDGNFG